MEGGPVHYWAQMGANRCASQSGDSLRTDFGICNKPLKLQPAPMDLFYLSVSDGSNAVLKSKI